MIFATPCQIDAVCLLMSDKKFKTQSLLYFSNIINNQELECDFRYKTILSLETKDIKNKNFFLQHSMIIFISNTKNRTLYRIPLRTIFNTKKLKLTKMNYLISNLF